MTEALDDSPDMLQYSSGNQVPFNMRVFGYCILLGGFITILANVIVGLLVALVGVRLAFTYNGVQIDVVKKRYRVYTAYAYFLKQGKWKSLESMQFVSVLGTNAGFEGFSRGGAYTKLTEKVWDVMLLSENHRVKWYVCRQKSEEHAWAEAGHIAGILDKKTAKYAPVLSAKSKANRERGRKR